MAHDVRYKLPPYVQGLVNGSLRGAEYQRKALAIGRDRLGELVTLADEARSSRERR